MSRSASVDLERDALLGDHRGPPRRGGSSGELDDAPADHHVVGAGERHRHAQHRSDPTTSSPSVDRRTIASATSGRGARARRHRRSVPRVAVEPGRCAPLRRPQWSRRPAATRRRLGSASDGDCAASTTRRRPRSRGSVASATSARPRAGASLTQSRTERRRLDHLVGIVSGDRAPPRPPTVVLPTPIMPTSTMWRRRRSATDVTASSRNDSALRTNSSTESPPNLRCASWRARARPSSRRRHPSPARR